VFLAYCDECDRQMLLPASHIRALHNLARGVIAVEMTCYEGHVILVLSGSDIDIPGPAPV
jgi:hypothetical protein